MVRLVSEVKETHWGSSERTNEVLKCVKYHLILQIAAIHSAQMVYFARVAMVL